MRCWRSISLVLAMAGSAAAQSPEPSLQSALMALEGTTSVRYLPQFSSGKLTACLIEFATLVRDHTSRQGRYSRVGGSFGFMGINSAIAPVLKVIVHDLDERTGELRPSTPQAAYIAAGTTTNASEVLKTAPSDSAGGIFVIFYPKSSVGLFLEAIANQRIKILINRTARGMDVPVDIELDVEDTSNTGKRIRSGRATSEMLTCVRALAESP